MTAERWLPFEYRDFYDVPRLILVERAGKAILFDSPFDEDADEYSDVFRIYRLSLAAARDLRDKTSWQGGSALGEFIGTIPVSEVEFDPSKRESLNDDVFERHGIE